MKRESTHCLDKRKINSTCNSFDIEVFILRPYISDYQTFVFFGPHFRNEICLTPQNLHVIKIHEKNTLKKFIKNYIKNTLKNKLKIH